MLYLQEEDSSLNIEELAMLLSLPVKDFTLVDGDDQREELYSTHEVSNE